MMRIRHIAYMTKITLLHSKFVERLTDNLGEIIRGCLGIGKLCLHFVQAIKIHRQKYLATEYGCCWLGLLWTALNSTFVGLKSRLGLGYLLMDKCIA